MKTYGWYKKNIHRINILYVFRGFTSPCNDTCPLAPRMAGGLAEWLRHFNDFALGETAEGAGMPQVLSH